jgi:hypothetical protein
MGFLLLLGFFQGIAAWTYDYQLSYEADTDTCGCQSMSGYATQTAGNEIMPAVNPIIPSGGTPGGLVCINVTGVDWPGALFTTRGLGEASPCYSSNTDFYMFEFYCNFCFTINVWYQWSQYNSICWRNTNCWDGKRAPSGFKAPKPYNPNFQGPENQPEQGPLIRRRLIKKEHYEKTSSHESYDRTETEGGNGNGNGAATNLARVPSNLRDYFTTQNLVATPTGTVLVKQWTAVSVFLLSVTVVTVAVAGAFIYQRLAKRASYQPLKDSVEDYLTF